MREKICFRDDGQFGPRKDFRIFDWLVFAFGDAVERYLEFFAEFE